MRGGLTYSARLVQPTGLQTASVVFFVRLARHSDQREDGHTEHHTLGAIGLVPGPLRAPAQAGVLPARFEGIVRRKRLGAPEPSGFAGARAWRAAQVPARRKPTGTTGQRTATRTYRQRTAPAALRALERSACQIVSCSACLSSPMTQRAAATLHCCLRGALLLSLHAWRFVVVAACVALRRVHAWRSVAHDRGATSPPPGPPRLTRPLRPTPGTLGKRVSSDMAAAELGARGGRGGVYVWRGGDRRAELRLAGRTGRAPRALSGALGGRAGCGVSESGRGGSLPWSGAPGCRGWLAWLTVTVDHDGWLRRPGKLLDALCRPDEVARGVAGAEYRCIPSAIERYRLRQYEYYTPPHISVEDLLEHAAAIANLEMLRTNDLPNQFQIEEIGLNALLLESKLVSFALDDSPTRKRILRQLDLHRSILAPIRRLPKELLMDIFFRVANESPLRTLQAATIIAGVCAFWRTVAHGLTKLWTKLVVKSLTDFDRYCELFLPITTEERRPGLRCDDPELLWPLWDRIEPYASCWRSITLVGRLDMLPNLKVLYMENLERLVVDAYDEPHSLEFSVLDFVVAPCLRHIALTLDALQNERQLHVPVTRALTSLEIDVMSPFPVTLTFSLLRACAETLQSLALKVRYPLEGSEGSYPTSASESDTFDLKALTKLRLVDPACALLNHINAPLIEELILSNVPVYGAQSLLGFLMRGQAAQHLIDLRVYQPEERDIPAWMPCLQLMGNLKDLHFDDLLSKREFLKQLAVRHAGRHPLLPSLRNLNVTNISFNEMSDVVRELCRSRAIKTQYHGQLAYKKLGWILDY
ncbi:uncharacterized protein SCHCODRAFT_02668861 [Schizophyllum commune H4-8]|uniref:uncharacterized protein n=1 Tax=Schizophyllum commune (strain H4-8 / FGSC 9210) TaxID=578458 RepID=UPI002160BB98|nr:uncharacterized protein SCHCODRAFT_02668861 [Schizophyllum commune H4-8]KAI5891535.1 hypothetical protein SCHCODRAFT_02668861 [Schizophyllum commune H4-8]